MRSETATIADELNTSTGNTIADGVLTSVVTCFEQAFPKQIRGFYLEGSQADGSSVVTSDVDLTIVFSGRLGEEEIQRAAKLCARCAASSHIKLDIEVTDDARLEAGATPLFKHGSRLLYGEDIRDRVPLMPLAIWTRDRMHASYWLMVHVFERRPAIARPLTFPDSDDEFFGYAGRQVRLADGSTRPSTRNLIRVTGWMATARLAWQAGQYVSRKRDCHVLYERWIGDEWSSLLHDIYAVCRGAWSYLIPEDKAGREQLREICARTLAFESAFLGRYRDFVLSELRSTDHQSREHALWVMTRIPLLDEEIDAAVSDATRHAMPR